MITYQYVDPAATGLNTGVPSGTDPSDPTDPVNWNDAWNVLQSGVNAAEASGIVYCRGTEVLQSTVDLDGNGQRDAPILIKGVSADGEEDGTRYELVCSGVNIGVQVTGYYYHVENFDIHSAQSECVDFSNNISKQHYITFINCLFRDSVAGVDLYYFRGDSYFDRCRAFNNTQDGFRMHFQSSVGNRAYFNKCISHDNADCGYEHFGVDATIFKDCIAHNNGTDGFYLKDGGTLINCIAHKNDRHGINISASDSELSIIEGCRLTGNGVGGVGYGINNTTNPIYVRGNYFQDNIDGDINNYYYDLGENMLNGSDVDYGYVDSSGDNFNLRSDASMRTIGVELP